MAITYYVEVHCVTRNWMQKVKGQIHRGIIRDPMV